MRCCAIVPTYNRAAVIRQTLDSLLSQTVPLAQIIVVDDGSADATRDVVRSCGGRITLLSKENGGKSSAINLALRHLASDIDLIWVFDDDDIAMPDALSRHVAALSRSGAGFSYSSYIASFENPDRTIKPLHDVRTPNVDSDHFLAELLIANFVSHPSLVVRRSVQEEVGGYDETLVRSQDYDMILRIARIARPAWVEGPTYYRRYHDGLRGSGRDRFAARQYEQKAHVYEKGLFRKVHGTFSLDEYLPRNSPFNEDDARIARITVMAIRGLWDLCAEDASRLSERAVPLSDANAKRLWRVGSRPAAALDMERGMAIRIPRHLRTVMAKAFLRAVSGDPIPLGMRIRIAWKMLALA